ncbi:MAG TPA: DNA translocase FtsK, partial [Microvirga sp.]|nr:DNA translocase FtsK [Microvirga sp.]
MPSDVRFTRTPDRVLKERRRQAAGRFPAEEAAPAAEAVQPTRPAEPPLPRPSPLMRRSEPAPEPQSIPPAPRRAPRQIFGHTGQAVSRDRDVTPKTAPEPDVARAPAAQEAVREPEVSAAHDIAAFDLPALRRSYSFLWQPGTYVLDPTLKAAPPAPPRKRVEDRVEVRAQELPAREAPARTISVEESVPRSRLESPPAFRPEAPTGEVPRRAAAAPIRLVQDEPRLPAAGRALRSHAPVAANDSHPAAHDPAPARASFTFELPPLDLLGEPDASSGFEVPIEVLQENAAILENVLWDFNVKGEIINVRPGPVVTLYELEPAPGTKSSRVISLSDDIARSMSAVSARVAVVQGRNAIGIELPNHKRETVFLRELLASQDFETSKHKLALCLGKTIGGEPVIADLARMPHLLVAGTTGSGKSVAINTMILSLLYRFTPEQCRLIMVDPKMLELSVYDGIPHLLTPVVTDPKKAVVALKWAVREMEDRYKKMSKVGVRNIDGFNARVAEATTKGEVITRTVEAGFDKATGELTYREE